METPRKIDRVTQQGTEAPEDAVCGAASREAAVAEKRDTPAWGQNGIKCWVEANSRERKNGNQKEKPKTASKLG